MRHLLTLFDARVVVVATVLVGLAALTSITLGRNRGTAWPLFIALTGAALIATLTIGNRGIIASDDGLAEDLTWWTRHWDTLPMLIVADLGWWMNVALFVPAALGWTLLTTRPVTVSLVLLAIVLGIETLQATVLSGAGDPSDVVANALGIAVGVTGALIWTRRRPLTSL